MQDDQQIQNPTTKSNKILTLSLILLTLTLIGFTAYLFIQLQQLQRPIKHVDTKETTNQQNLPEKKLEITGRDLRLKYFQTDTSVFTVLVDYTPKPHTPADTDIMKVTSIPQQNVISSWEEDFSSNSRSDLADVDLSKIFLSSDSRFLVFETVEDGISIYDYQGSKLIRSLDKIIPEIKGSNLVGLEENKIKLGLFEGMGGICDENVFEVNLLDNSVIQLQDKETMEKC